MTDLFFAPTPLPTDHTLNTSRLPKDFILLEVFDNDDKSIASSLHLRDRWLAKTQPAQAPERQLLLTKQEKKKLKQRSLTSATNLSSICTPVLPLASLDGTTAEFRSVLESYLIRLPQSIIPSGAVPLESYYEGMFEQTKRPTCAEVNVAPVDTVETLFNLCRRGATLTSAKDAELLLTLILQHPFIDAIADCVHELLSKSPVFRFVLGALTFSKAPLEYTWNDSSLEAIARMLRGPLFYKAFQTGISRHFVGIGIEKTFSSNITLLKFILASFPDTFYAAEHIADLISIFFGSTAIPDPPIAPLSVTCDIALRLTGRGHSCASLLGTNDDVAISEPSDSSETSSNVLLGEEKHSTDEHLYLRSTAINFATYASEMNRAGVSKKILGYFEKWSSKVTVDLQRVRLIYKMLLLLCRMRCSKHYMGNMHGSGQPAEWRTIMTALKASLSGIAEDLKVGMAVQRPDAAKCHEDSSDLAPHAEMSPDDAEEKEKMYGVYSKLIGIYNDASSILFASDAEAQRRLATLENKAGKTSL